MNVAAAGFANPAAATFALVPRSRRVRESAARETMGSMTHTRRLIVMRHARAGELPGGPDFERALRPRGRRDAAAAGSWLAASGFRPDAVICSAARRTRQTWQYVAPQLGGEPEFSAEMALYQADGQDVLDFVRQTPAEVGTLMYIGHNPAAADLVAALAGAEQAFPTSAVAVLDLADTWAALAPGDGEVAAFWVPGHQ